MSSGKIVQVIGPVVDVEFSLDQSLPDINNALVVYKNDEKKSKVVLEVALELGDGVIRTIDLIFLATFIRAYCCHLFSALDISSYRRYLRFLSRTNIITFIILTPLSFNPVT